MKKVLDIADNMEKPVVAVFLGSDPALFKGHKAIGAFSLEEAACKVANILRPGCSVPFHFSEEEIRRIVKQERNRYCAKQKYFRGLYCGGTFTEEGLLYYSNIPGI